MPWDACFGMDRLMCGCGAEGSFESIPQSDMTQMIDDLPHLDKESAALHGKALASFTRRDDES